MGIVFGCHRLPRVGASDRACRPSVGQCQGLKAGSSSGRWVGLWEFGSAPRLSSAPAPVPPDPQSSPPLPGRPCQSPRGILRPSAAPRQHACTHAATPSHRPGPQHTHIQGLGVLRDAKVVVVQLDVAAGQVRTTRVPVCRSRRVGRHQRRVVLRGGSRAMAPLAPGPTMPARPQPPGATQRRASRPSPPPSTKIIMGGAAPCAPTAIPPPLAQRPGSLKYLMS